MIQTPWEPVAHRQDEILIQSVTDVLRELEDIKLESANFNLSAATSGDILVADSGLVFRPGKVMTSSYTVSGDWTVGGALAASGRATISGALDAKAAVGVSGALGVVGNISSSGQVSGTTAHFATASGFTINATGQFAFDGKAVSTSPTFTVTNYTSDRTYDANSYTPDEIADVLGTLIKDLIDKGILRGTVT